MYPAAPITASSDEVAVIVTSAQFAVLTAMASDQWFIFCSTTDCWIKQAANPTASAAAGSMFVPAKTIIFINGVNGAKLAVIRDAVDGKASLTPVKL